MAQKGGITPAKIRHFLLGAPLNNASQTQTQGVAHGAKFSSWIDVADNRHRLSGRQTQRPAIRGGTATAPPAGVAGNMLPCYQLSELLKSVDGLS